MLTDKITNIFGDRYQHIFDKFINFYLPIFGIDIFYLLRFAEIRKHVDAKDYFFEIMSFHQLK